MVLCRMWNQIFTIIKIKMFSPKFMNCWNIVSRSDWWLTFSKSCKQIVMGYGMHLVNDPIYVLAHWQLLKFSCYWVCIRLKTKTKCIHHLCWLDGHGLHPQWWTFNMILIYGWVDNKFLLLVVLSRCEAIQYRHLKVVPQSLQLDVLFMNMLMN